MVNVSPRTSVEQFELWMFRPDGEVGPLTECGLFGAQRAAEHTKSAILDWFYLGSWWSTLDQLPPEFQDDLYFIRKGLLAAGFDLARVTVEVRPARVVCEIAEGGRRAVRTSVYDPAADSDPEDTSLEPVVVQYTIETNDPRN